MGLFHSLTIFFFYRLPASSAVTASCLGQKRHHNHAFECKKLRFSLSMRLSLNSKLSKDTRIHLPWSLFAAVLPFLRERTENRSKACPNTICEVLHDPASTGAIQIPCNRPASLKVEMIVKCAFISCNIHYMYSYLCQLKLIQ